ncbi:hypothetical protein [Sinorhizobium meliloti]|uniref:hypothetical protein n=1 Tax=Rhizobium meliloti TaxID=382 RepID=UPI000415C8D2|nr:hypothetical protein [Sinorhizobium meliloti]
MSRRIIRGNDVAIATRAFDDWAHPTALLIMRGHGTMLWWPERFCRRASEHGRFVIRYG